MHSRMSGLWAPALVLIALAALPAVAQGQEMQVGGKTATGSVVQASSSNLVFQSSHLNIECTTNDLTLFMQSKSTGDVIGGGFTGPEGGPCPTSFEELTIDFSTNAATGWAMIFGAEDQGVLVGNQGIQFSIQPQYESEDVGTCNYVAESVPFTYNQGEDLTINVEGELALEEGSDEFCVESGILHGTFTATSTGGQVTMD